MKNYLDIDIDIDMDMDLLMTWTPYTDEGTDADT